MSSESEPGGPDQAPETKKLPVSDITLKQASNGGWTAEVSCAGAHKYGVRGMIYAFTNTTDLVAWISEIPRDWKLTVVKTGE